MKRILLLPLVLLLASCVRTADIPPTATLISDELPLQPPTAILAPTGTPVSEEPTPESAAPTEAGELVEEPTEAPDIEEPTETEASPEPTATEEPEEETPEDEDVPPTDEGDEGAKPTRTPDPAAFNPEETFGIPQLRDEFITGANWVDNTNALPDTDNLRLQAVDGYMLVTGKKVLFDTWWFTGGTLTDFYIEMTAETDECAGKDSYGVIFYGPPKGQTAHGYVVSFSCDGAYLMRRIDSSSPYSAEELLLWTESEDIHSGSNETNVLGIWVSQGTFTIYANGYEQTTIVDDTFTSGRYGLYVNAGKTQDFTYRVDRIRIWKLD